MHLHNNDMWMSKWKEINTKCVKTWQEPGGLQHSSKRGTQDGPTFQTRKSEMLHHELFPPASCLSGVTWLPSSNQRKCKLTITAQSCRWRSNIKRESKWTLKAFIDISTKKLWTPINNSHGPDGEELNIWCIRGHNQKVITVVLQWRNVSCWFKNKINF